MSTATVERQNVTSDYGDGTPQEVRATIGVVTVTFDTGSAPSARTRQRWRQMPPFEATAALFRWISRGVAERAAAAVIDEPWGGRLETWAGRTGDARRQWRHRHPGVNPVDAEIAGAYPEDVAIAFDDLSPRQGEVVALLIEGMTQAQIADRLGLSVRSVEAHLAKVRERTRSTTTVQAVARVAAATAEDGRGLPRGVRFGAGTAPEWLWRSEVDPAPPSASEGAPTVSPET